MSRERFRRTKELFAAACDLPPGKQSAFLDDACAGDEALRADVEALLAADRTPAGAIDTPLPDRHPERIGGYRVLGVLGQGGMGTVYAAEQENPRRRVAVKVMAFTSPDLLRRFEYEAEILGRLQHPGIASIIEAGVAEGRPFFAMELIEGAPLTEYVARAKLALPARLELLARIADAVQHAHRHGVIHRDLKPGNILVEPDGTPRLLDFGIAKLAGEGEARLTTLGTRAGQMLGTVPYMSPEQFGGDPAAVDARCDVYALGVIGYELVAGRTPRDFEGLSIAEAMARAQTDDAPRLGTLATEARGDVETIVAKALERDRERRYGSAGEFAADLRRFLNHEPIVARPPSAAYQLRKLARRHRALFGGAAVALVALVAGAVVSFTLYLKKEDERGRAVQAKADAEKAQRLAEARAETRDEIVGFLVGLFDVVDPAEARGRTVTAKEILDEGARVVRARLDRQPEVRSQLMGYMGRIYLRLGLEEQARSLLADALRIRLELYGEGHPETGSVLLANADAAIEAGRYEDALAFVDRAEKTGWEPAACHHTRAHAYHMRGDVRSAEASYRAALAIAPSDNARHGLSGVLRLAGRLDEAESLAREALRQALATHDETSPAVASRRSVLGNILTERGRFAEAAEQHERALAAQEKLTGQESVGVCLHLNDLAVVRMTEGKPEAAEPLLQRALTISRRWRGDDHPFTIKLLANLANNAARRARLDDALARYRTALAALRRISGDRQAGVVTILTSIGSLEAQKQRYKEARAVLEEAVALGRKLHGTDKHPDVVYALGHLASVRADAGELKDASALYERLLPLAIGIWGEGSPDVANWHFRHGKLLVSQGRYADARSKLLRARTVYEKIHGPDADHRIGCTSMLAVVHMHLGEYEEAGTLLDEVLAAYEKKHGPKHEEFKRVLANLAQLRQSQGDYVRARPLFKRLLADPPDNAVGQATIKNNYAMVLLGLHDLAEAEKLFREARTQFQSVAGPRHPAIGTLSNNVGECLRLAGKVEDAVREFEGALEIFRAAHGAEHPMIANTMTKLGQARGDAKLLRAALAMRRKLLPAGHPDIAKTLLAIGDEPALAEAVAILAKVMPDGPLTARARSDWAEQLRATGRQKEARDQLALALPVLQRLLGPDHPATREAATRSGAG